MAADLTKVASVEEFKEHAANVEEQFADKLTKQVKAYQADRPADHDLSPELKDHYDQFAGDIAQHADQYKDKMGEINEKFLKMYQSMLKEHKEERAKLYMA